jgi:hypothetical protein
LLEDTGYSEERIVEEISSTVLAYDNMCHVDNLKIARKNLPLPHP